MTSTCRKYDRGTNQTERERMRNSPPRILLTNYMMLEYLLIRPADRDALFANHRCHFLVLDEVHTYRGVLGSNIALLLRRLRAHLTRARQDWSPDVPAEQHAARYPTLLNVGTSATIKSLADPNLSGEERTRRRDAAVQDFFSRLTGEPPDRIRVVGEVLESIAVPTEARFAPTVPTVTQINVADLRSVEVALTAAAGIAPTGDLACASRQCRLLWLLNQWLVAHPMSVGQIVQKLQTDVPERNGVDAELLRKRS